MSKKNYYLPRTDEDRAALLEHFRDHIADYATTFALTPTQLSPQAADAAYYRWLVGQCAAARSYAAGMVSWRDAVAEARDIATVQLPELPHTPAPDVVPAGIIPRFIALVKAIKTHPSYTEAAGKALRIEGGEAGGPDPATARPDLTGARAAADRVEIPWKKGPYHGIRLEVDRGDGKGWAFLAIDTRPDYADTEPFPAAGAAAVWRYRGIYLLHDEKIGQWSPTVSVTVG